MLSKKSFWWYIPIMVVLFLGYLLGGGLTYGIHFLHWCPSIKSVPARFILELFGMGLLGATMYCSKWWAKDMEEAIDEPKYHPHVFDAFGYAITIIGGGITGVILFMAFHSGVILVISDKSFSMRTSSCYLIAFSGGLFHFRVRRWLEDQLNDYLEKKETTAMNSGKTVDAHPENPSPPVEP